MKRRLTDILRSESPDSPAPAEPSYVDRLWLAELRSGCGRARDFAPEILHRLGLEAPPPGAGTAIPLGLRLRRRFAIAAIVALAVSAGVLLRLEAYESRAAAAVAGAAEPSPRYLVDRVFTTVDRFAYFVNVADANVASAEWMDVVPASLEELLPALTQFLILDTLDPTGPSIEAVPVDPGIEGEEARAEHASLS